MDIKKTSFVAAAVLAVLSLCSVSAYAQSPETGAAEVRPVQELSLKVAFRQGKRQIDRAYMDNASSISAFTSALSRYAYDSTIEVVSVDIIGGASIEGSAELNRDLSNNRAERMVEILRQYASVPSGLVHVNSRGVNWEDVIDMVESDTMVPSRTGVLDILRNTPEASRKAALESFAGGAPYNYMYEHIFPYVRTGKMTVTFRAVPKQPQTPAVHDTVYVVQRDTVYHIHQDDPGYPRNINQNIMNVNTDRYGRRRGRPSDDPEYPLSRINRLDTLLRTPVMAFRSNLLLPLMNVGVEVPVGNRWSFSADWNYPWVWRLPDHKDCFEFLGGTAEARYWFGWRHLPGEKNTKYRLLGHSLGLVLGAGYYDFQEQWAGFQGEYGAAGIDYQYAMPLGKKGKLHLEFDLTLGVITARNIPYDVFTTGGILLHRDGIIDHFSWAGPIKGGVSLVVPVYRKEKYALDAYPSDALAYGDAEPQMEPAPLEPVNPENATDEMTLSKRDMKRLVKAERKEAKAAARAQKETARAEAKAETAAQKADQKAARSEAKAEADAQKAARKAERQSKSKNEEANI